MIGDQRIIDFHGHTGRQDAYNMIDDPAAILHAMDRVGIDVACLFNIFHPDGTTGNDITARFVAAHPDRFVGFAYVSPMMAEGMVAELTRAVDELGMVAIKLYPPYTKWDLNEPIWHPIYEFANERGLAIIFHTGTDPHSHPGSAGGLRGPVSERQLCRRPRGQRSRAAGGGDQGGADLSERLPGDLLDFSHAGRHRAAG